MDLKSTPHDDLDWLRAYVGVVDDDAHQEDGVRNDSGGETLEQPAVKSIKSKPKSKSKNDQPFPPKFPPAERVAVVTAQFFDNGASPGKGKNQHVLKLRLYMDDGQPVRVHSPNRTYFIALLDLKLVSKWAVAENSANRMSDDVLATYVEAAGELHSWLSTDPDANWVKMGHVAATKPGTHYHQGQFATVRMTKSGEMSAVLHLFGDRRIDFGTMTENTRSTKANAAKYYAKHDPHGLLGPSEIDE